MNQAWRCDLYRVELNCFESSFKASLTVPLCGCSALVPVLKNISTTDLATATEIFNRRSGRTGWLDYWHSRAPPFDCSNRTFRTFFLVCWIKHTEDRHPAEDVVLLSKSSGCFMQHQLRDGRYGLLLARCNAKLWTRARRIWAPSRTTIMRRYYSYYYVFRNQLVCSTRVNTRFFA